MSNPNFPQDLNIRPSQPSQEEPDAALFDYAHQQEAIRVFGIAGKVWKAAYALNAYIRPQPGLVFDPPLFTGPDAREPLRILELGSGSGIVAATMAPLLQRARDIMFVTDLPEVCALLEQNLRAHNDLLLVRPLSWGSSEHARGIAAELLDLAKNSPYLTHILCSDLIYFPELLAPLLRSCIELSSPPFVAVPSDVELIISYKIRSLAKETPFWAAFGLWFEFAPILARKTGSSWRRFGADFEDPTFVFVARRREKSFNWIVPSNDEDLMYGAAGDDTFETLLLMSLDDPDVTTQ
ncbi:putative methyltransferase-domain-containing protein [Mycena belliarum]|uniref:Methyltransferase-domain-containing protein n=1 Tax=Mycena belliarum TaxID=1033014 RepID=A0AAD6UK53_9AGAR|nr:putative methyltransferase-domain-containing protein [Mycena belliae]